VPFSLNLKDIEKEKQGILTEENKSKEKRKCMSDSDYRRGIRIVGWKAQRMSSSWFSQLGF
jgi:hypothetical protein